MEERKRARSARMADHARLLFSRCYDGEQPAVVSRAPGRTDLMGGHTDYNLGFVLSIAIDRATYIAARPRADRVVHAYTETYDETTEFSLDDIQPDPQARWSNYLRGTAWALSEAGYRLAGMDAVIASDVPIAAGVSSSASFEVASALALLACAEVEIDSKQMALLCQKAENEFVGMRCGILDQFSSVLGQRSAAVLIDCDDYSHRIVLIRGEMTVVVCDTNKPRELVGSEYNTLRSQCEAGAALLGVDALRRVDLPTLQANRHKFDDEEMYWRCYYIVTENDRVLAAADALNRGDLGRVGALQNQSMAMARDYFKISVPELDVMWELCNQVPGCWGARIVGAGFGGALLALCHPQAAAELMEYVPPRYKQRTGIEPNVFATPASEGAGYV